MITKKKTWLKMLSLVLLLPLLLVFTACGDVNAQLNTKATCNTTGEYNQEATRDELNGSIGQQTTINNGGYRMTIEATGSAMGEEISSTINAIVKGDEATLKMTAKDPQTGKNVDGYVYVTDGYIYTNAEGQKVRMEGSLNTFFNTEGFAEMPGLMDSITDINGILNMMSSSDVEISVDGNNYKIEFNTIAGMEVPSLAEMGVNLSDLLKDMVAYLNFDDNGNLVAMNFSFGMEMGEFFNITINVTMSAFDGEIQFPSFNGYTEMAPEEEQIPDIDVIE